MEAKARRLEVDKLKAENICLKIQLEIKDNITATYLKMEKF
jgi:hypothetical protein